MSTTVDDQWQLRDSDGGLPRPRHSIPWLSLNFARSPPLLSGYCPVYLTYFEGSVLRNSIPAASSGTSTLATVLSVARSIISTVPGSDPTPSTETNA
jgi:hypothetical protein